VTDVARLFRAARTPDFDRLYRDHAAAVYRYAYAVLGNHADAEDVTQQTFLNAYRAMARGTKPRKAENWLLTIAHNEVRRHFRSAHGRPFEVELDERVPQQAHERSEPSVADVLRALQHLPPAQRSALVMREFEGRSYAEIADTMEVTQSALEALLFRARRGLAAELEDTLTCAEAEQALSRRLDGRLPRREARRLKAHLRECPLCARFEDDQKRQRSLLEGLSVIPVPASLYLVRGEQAAAAGLGTTAVAAGGSAAVGAGGAGIAVGLIAKAAAVTAAVGVAGGASYGVAAQSGLVAKDERKPVHAAAVADTRRGARAAQVHAALARGERPGRARPAIARASTKRQRTKSAPVGGPPPHANAFKKAKTRTSGVRRALGHARRAATGGPPSLARKAKPTPTKAKLTPTKTKAKPAAPKVPARPRPAKRNGDVGPTQQKPKVKPRGPAPAAAKPRTKPPRNADPPVLPGVVERGPKKSSSNAP
jgi:RNA polymerase sigma factor (sigma-70 family)